MLEIIKRKGIDDFIKEFVPQKVEQEEKVVVAGIFDKDNLMKKYELFLHHFSGRMPRRQPRFVAEKDYAFLGKHKVNEALSEKQLNAFLAETQKYEDKENYGVATGFFLSKLVQNAYDSGARFLQITPKMELSEFPIYLDIREEEPLGLEYRGRLKNGMGTLAKNLKIIFRGRSKNCGFQSIESVFLIDGEVGKCGNEARSSTYIISGDVNEGIGNRAEDSDYTIFGRLLGECANEAKRCNFTFHGMIVDPYDTHRRFSRSEGCTYRTDNASTLTTLIDVVPWGNRIVMIESGKEEVLRDL